MSTFVGIIGVIIYRFHDFYVHIHIFLDKGVKVVRSPSDILALIKSCDSSSDKAVCEIALPASLPVNNCVSPFTELPQNVPQKIIKTIGPKRMIKSNVRLQAFESEHNQEVKDVPTQPPTSSLRSKK